MEASAEAFSLRVWRPTSLKTCDFDRATTPTTHLPLSIYFLNLFFTPLFLSLLSTKQILFPLLLPKLHSASWAWLRAGFVQKTPLPLLRSNNFFSDTLRQVRKGGGTGLLISNNWKYSTYTPLCNNFSLESHAFTVTAPVKLHVVVIYRPPGQLGTFLEELYGLLSLFPEDGSPLIVFGDFNIHLNKPHAVNFLFLLVSFDVKRLTTTSTHKSGS